MHVVRPFLAFLTIVTALAGAAAADAPAPSSNAGEALLAALPPGSVVSRANHGLAQGALPPEFLERVARGELELEIQAPTDLPPRSAYLEATEKHAGQVRLGADGSLEGYVAGLPFPALDPADPQCGLKAAWNLRYHDTGNGSEAWGLFRHVEGSGRVAREIEFYYVRAYGMHRSPENGGGNDWEDAGILYKEFYQALSPLDVRNVMNLKFRYDDDRRADDNWAYLPAERKVRKMAVPHEEATMGTDLLREDYYGFAGHLHEHRWRCLGAGTYLAPVGVRGTRARLDANGFPAEPWEPREVLLVEATPENRSHPYARRVLYVDRQMSVALYVVIYDHDGVHAKTLFTVYGDPRHNPGNEEVRIPVWVAEVMLNHRSGSKTITEITRGVFDRPIPDDRLTVQQMLSLGR